MNWNTVLRRMLFVGFIACLSGWSVRANESARGWCEAGAQVVITSGLTSTTQVQGSFPLCTVTVFVHGGGLATIYSDNNSTPTPLANPFTANTNGQWQFYAANGHFDVQMSGAGFPTPVTYPDVLLNDPGASGGGVVFGVYQNVPFSATPIFNASQASIFTITLTGNVTSSTVNNPVQNGQAIEIDVCQDNTGNRQFTWPANFQFTTAFPLLPGPNICTPTAWFFNGANWLPFFTSASYATLPMVPLAFSATPTFTANFNTAYSMILTGNVTSSTIGGLPANGNLLKLHLCQGAGGPWTFSFPASFLNTTTIQTTGCTDATYSFDSNSGNWSQLIQPASGGGGGACTPGGPNGAIQKNVSSACGASNLLETSTTPPHLSVGDDINNILGPNPATYVTAYGAVAINPNSVPKATSVSCVATSTSLTYSGLTGTLLNGYGITLPGCDGANGLTTPVITSVTPVLNAGGLNTGYVVAAPAGVTKYCYIVALRNKQWGLTTGSVEVCTTTGPTSLGPQTMTITSATRSNATTTYLVNSTAGVSAGALLHIAGTSDDSSCGGDPIINTVVDGTHFTAITGMDTRNGGATSCTGGTAKYDVGINIVLPQNPAGGFQYLVYGNQQGAETFLNYSLPTGLTNHGTDPGYLSVQDWGSTLEVPPPLPYWVANTPPTQAANNNLSTTIASGCPTACGASGTLTLGVAAGNTLTSTMVFDDAPTIKLADNVVSAFGSGGGGYLYTPFGDESGANNNYCFVTNSYLTLNSTLSIGAPICAGDTIQSNAQVRGDLAPNKLRQSQPQFALSAQIPLTCATGSPCLWTTTGWVNNITLGFPANSVGMLDTTTGTSVVHDVNFVTDQTHDCMGTLLYILGSFGAAFGGRFENTSWLPGPATATPGNCMAPSMITKQNSEFSFENISMSERGFAFAAPTFGLKINIDQKQEMQSSSEPMFTFMFQQAGNSFVQAIVNDVTPDTIGTPVIANWSGAGSSITGNVIYENSGLPSNNQPIFSGKPFSSIFVTNVPTGLNANQVGQNVNVCVTNGQPGIYNNGTFPLGSSTSPTWCNVDYIQGVTNAFMTDILPPPAPTVVVNATGSIAIGAHTITITPVFYNGTASGGNGRPSLAASFTTTSSGCGGPCQSITVSNYAVAGAISYIATIDGFIANVGGCAIPQITTTSFTYSSGLTCGFSQLNIPAAGPVTITQGLVSSQTQRVGQFTDFVQGTSFGNPPTGSARIDVDSLTNFFTCTLSSGTSCMPPAPPCGVSLSIQYNNSGVCGGIPVPASPNNVPQVFRSTPVGGVGTPGGFQLSGIVPRTTVCPSNIDTILDTDRSGIVLWNDASPCAVGLFQAGTGGGSANSDWTLNPVFIGCNIGAGTVTVTPTTSTITIIIPGNVTSGNLNQQLTKGQCATFYTDNTNYIVVPFTGPTVTSVSNSDGTLTISPTTGAVIASLALGHANTWTATQTFPNASITNAELANSCMTVGGTLICLGGSGSPAAPTITIPNASSVGTTANMIATETGAPQTAVIYSHTSTTGYIGICTAGCSTSGSATITQLGLVNCIFDSATIAGDIVQPSSTTDGNCHDTNSAAYPAPNTGDVVGVVQVTNTLVNCSTAPGCQVLLFPPRNNTLQNVVTASANFTSGNIPKAAGANKALTDSGIAAANICAPGSFSTLTDGATVTWALGSAICANAGLTFTVHSGSRTLAITGPVNGGSYVVWIKQDATGGEGLTLGSGCTWKVSNGGAGAITPSAGANAIDVLAFTYDGTNCYANFNKNFN